MIKKIIQILSLFFIFHTAFAVEYVTTAIQQQQLTPEQALQKLIQGNERYVSQNLREFTHEAVLSKTARSQHPFAFVLSCVDSRSVPEMSFDQTLGNVFVGRVAGNVADKNILPRFCISCTTTAESNIIQVNAGFRKSGF